MDGSRTTKRGGRHTGDDVSASGLKLITTSAGSHKWGKLVAKHATGRMLCPAKGLV